MLAAELAAAAGIPTVIAAGAGLDGRCCRRSSPARRRHAFRGRRRARVGVQALAALRQAGRARLRVDEGARRARARAGAEPARRRRRSWDGDFAPATGSARRPRRRAVRARDRVGRRSRPRRPSGERRGRPPRPARAPVTAAASAARTQSVPGTCRLPGTVPGRVPGRCQMVPVTSARVNPAADPLRANVRLLGEILGEVIVEQEGEELLELEERIRASPAPAARRPARGDAVAALVAGLDLERQALVLRAFALFFQLANIAEQHHRVRRRRAYEHEGRTPPESLADARERIGAPRTSSRAAARRVSVELVLTAHPTEATRRTVLRRTRVAALLARARRPGAPPSRSADQAELAEEMTILWQTDEVRSQRPRVTDEIRHGLWFFEESFWETAPRAPRALRRARPGAPPALRFGTWIGGDLDGNPHTGAATVEAALEEARRSRRPLPRRRARARALVGHRLAVSRARRAIARDGASCPDVPDRHRTPTSRTGAGSPRSGTGSAPTIRVGGRAARGARPGRREPARPPRRADRRRRARRAARAGRDLRPPPRQARPAHPLPRTARARAAPARDARRAAAAQRRHGRSRSTG